MPAMNRYTAGKIEGTSFASRKFIEVAAAAGGDVGREANGVGRQARNSLIEPDRRLARALRRVARAVAAQEFVREAAALA